MSAFMDGGLTPPICFGNGSVVREETRRVIKFNPPAR
jgi:hypothetical protein